MTPLRDIDLPPTIRTYRAAAEVILGWMPDWISQRDFDLLAFKQSPMERAWFMTNETIVLGEPGGYRKELDLLQHLIVCGLAENEARDGMIWYRRKPR